LGRLQKGEENAKRTQREADDRGILSRCEGDGEDPRWIVCEGSTKTSQLELESEPVKKKKIG